MDAWASQNVINIKLFCFIVWLQSPWLLLSIIVQVVLGILHGLLYFAYDSHKKKHWAYKMMCH